ncbi:MAG TPA: BatA domain-containing protein [Pirellulaceae bacterium]|nr:BatA domain-containing protein [Planctomycetales bacterium]MCB9937542.1 BatA domain-containing protein [Planctomycetaceae bacterium]HRX77584.1 BatA domain-containing protein [Pirellulaceae bacterium]
MSLLAPLYFLGLAAISLPILFHLIRRTPRGRQQFSSLMFLSPSPPRLTRRSRIENWLLLLLRAAALILLAMAFARPFLRQVANLSLDGVRGRRVAILLDTSASMQRDGVWQQAITKLNHTLDDLDPADEVALYTFDGEVTAVVPFAEQATMRLEKSTHEVVRTKATELSPSWQHSDLGTALVTIAEELTLSTDETDTLAVAQIMVISDMQQGADLKAVQGYEWPEEVRVAVLSIDPADPSNGTLSLLRTEDESESIDTIRVRVANSVDSSVDQFHVGWAGPTKTDADGGHSPPYKTVPIYVPAGQSRVVQLPQLTGQESSDRLVLTGDAAQFDNTFYVVPQVQDEVELVYIGSDKPDDPAGLLYYLDLALSETPQRKVQLATQPPDESLATLTLTTRLAVLTAPLTKAGFERLNGYVQSGGSALIVPTTAESATSLAATFDEIDYIPSETGTRDGDYRMFVDIDFSHPLFKPFATPRYSDFTKIHFWNHQRFALISEHTADVLANFDNGDPAFWQYTIGNGKLYVLASGWHPDDSQLALSTKFVPLLNTMLDQAAGSPVEMPSFVVGDAVPMPADTKLFTVTKPNGTKTELDDEDHWFRETDEPGIYEIQGGTVPIRFAVNLMARETDTAMMDLEQLSELGIQLGEHATREEESDRQRQLRDIELESQQQLWRWLIVVVLGVLALETWLAGRGSRTRTRSAGDVE